MWQRSAIAIALAVAVACLATDVQAADHEMYYNCSRVPFCARLRTAIPEANAIYTADLTNIDIVNGATVVPLKNADQSLVLKITALIGGQYHVVIEEPDSHRYKLEHSLAEEPVSVNEMQVYSRSDEHVHIKPVGAETGNHYKISTKNGFTVEFYHDDDLQSSIDASRIIVENTNSSQAFSFAVQFYNSNFLMGLAEHAQGLPLLHTADGKVDPYRLKNADNWAYEINSTMAMYGSVPVIYSHGPTTSGIFVHNAAQQWVDIDVSSSNSSAYFMAEGGTLDVFFFLGPTIKDTVLQYTNLTGTSQLPGQWVFGFQQCKWGYYSQDDVKNVISNFDAGNFSLDVIWLDYNWTNAGRYFEWEPTNYSDPIGLMNWMEETHRKLVILNDPHIKIDSGYDFYVGADNQKLFVNNSNGVDSYVSTCWPGNSSWLDFLNPATRNYYASFFSTEHLNGTKTLAGIWNDMNEPALFDETIEKSLTPDLVQYQGVLHRDVHNIYGLTQTMSTYSGLVARHAGQVRPFILTRSFFAGTQRYAAIWSGDNTADWPYIYVSWPMCMTLNLIGIALCGADVGGFEGLPPDDMFIRWYQAGAWLPFMRAHSNIDSPRREPYLWPNTTQDHLREAIQFRYKHIAVWYTEFYNHHITGEPVVRPLFYNYPQDKNTFNINDEIMLGTDILARSVYEADVTSVDVYFPDANSYWYQIANETQKVYKGNASYTIPVDISFIPVFYRAGSIVSRKETVRKSSTFMQEDPFTLHVMTNIDNTAEGVLYIDDYESFEYRDNHRHNYVKFTYDGNSSSFSISELDPQQDATGFDIKITEIHVHTIDPTSEDIYNVKQVSHTAENVPLSAVDFKLQKTVLL